MSNETYHFKIGRFECMAVSDGTLTYTPPAFPPPATLLFPSAPRKRLEGVLVEHNLRPEQWTEWTSPYICLLIKTHEHLVLVDTGAGGLAPTTGRLMQNLQDVRVAPKDIDTVILTHGHPDHIGGNTDADGNLAFPDARYIMWKDEWDFWTSEQAEQKLDEHLREILVKFACENLPPIQGKVDLFDQDKEIVSGIRAVAAPGHTPGHMALEVNSEGERLLCVSDVALHPIHLEQLDWHAAIDFVPDQAVATRRRILQRAADQKALILGFHFPFPGLGQIEPKGDGWQWQPMKTA